jgi:Short C-terminal domain
VTETGDHNLEVAGAPRRVAVAEWSQPGFPTFRLYDDGTLVRELWTPAGQEVLKDSIVGATARVERTGARMLLRDTRRAFLVIQGPQVALSVRINNYVNVAASVRRFAEQINRVAQTLGPDTTGGHPDLSVAEQIRRLSELHAQGVLTDAEFAQAKTRLLGDA